MATAHGAAHDHSHDDHDHHTPTGWRRYVYSTNHKDIGTMYLVFAIFAALIGATFSVVMRLELLQPGVQYFNNADGTPDGHLWNTVVTAHGLIMVFFVVMPALIAAWSSKLASVCEPIRLRTSPAISSTSNTPPRPRNPEAPQRSQPQASGTTSPAAKPTTP